MLRLMVVVQGLGFRVNQNSIPMCVICGFSTARQEEFSEGAQQQEFPAERNKLRKRYGYPKTLKL